MKNVLNSLEVFSRSIANTPNLAEFDRINNNESRVSQASSRQKNASVAENRQDQSPVATKVDERMDDVMVEKEEKRTFKPNFRKERPAEDRVWKEENKTPEPETHKTPPQLQPEEPKVVNISKPTFNIKKKEIGNNDVLQEKGKHN